MTRGVALCSEIRRDHRRSRRRRRKARGFRAPPTLVWNQSPPARSAPPSLPEASRRQLPGTAGGGAEEPRGEPCPRRCRLPPPCGREPPGDLERGKKHFFSQRCNLWIAVGETGKMRLFLCGKATTLKMPKCQQIDFNASLVFRLTLLPRQSRRRGCNNLREKDFCWYPSPVTGQRDDLESQGLQDQMVNIPRPLPPNLQPICPV
nr:uncharacterized protein LOC102150273 [Equus caballus]